MAYGDFKNLNKRTVADKVLRDKAFNTAKNPKYDGGDSRYIYQNELDKACFKHHMAYGDFKDLNRRTASGKILRDRAFNIAKNPKYDGYQNGFASMVYKFFDKKHLLEQSKTKLCLIKN